MAITFEREQQATIQAYHRNRHDPRIKDLGVDTVLDMVRIFRIRKYWFYRYLSWARYGWSWASNFFYPEHHLGWYARIWNFCGATRPTSRLVKITSQKNLRIFMQPGCCDSALQCRLGCEGQQLVAFQAVRVDSEVCMAAHPSGFLSVGSTIARFFGCLLKKMDLIYRTGQPTKRRFF